MSRWRTPLLLALGFGLLYLFMLGGLSVIDYDEACYAEVAREMALSGDLLRPTLEGGPFFEKPPLLYWSMLAGFRLFGVTTLGVRFFDTLAAVALLLVLYGFARRPLGERGAVVSALVLGTSFLFLGLARAATTDVQLTLWLVCTLGCLWRAFEDADDPWGNGGHAWFLLACVASGMAMLTKGLVGFLFPGGAVFLWALYERRLRQLFAPVWLIPGLPILAGVGLSWYLALGLTDGFGFMGELFWEHHVGRFLHPMEKHSGPFVYYIPVVLIGFLPWSPLLFLTWTRTRLFAEDGERQRFLRLFAIFGAMILAFFSLAATKLPNYVLPVWPAMALLVGALWAEEDAVPHTDDAGGFDPGWRRALVGIGVSLGVVALALCAVPTVLGQIPDIVGDKVRKMPGLLVPADFGPWPYAVAAILAAGAVATVRARHRRDLTRIPLVLVATVTGLFVVATLTVVPRYEAHFRAPLHDLGRKAAALAPAGERVVLIGVRLTPSVTFYSGRYTRDVSRRDVEGLAALFAGPAPQVGITVEGYLDRIQGPGRLEVLEQAGGYVLFRCSPARPGSDGSGSREAGSDRAG